MNFDDHIPGTRHDEPMLDKYEQAARALGWVREGDCGGFIYNTNDYESWKAAASWAPDDGPIYETWQECCEMEGIETNA